MSSSDIHCNMVNHDESCIVMAVLCFIQALAHCRCCLRVLSLLDHFLEHPPLPQSRIFDELEEKILDVVEFVDFFCDRIPANSAVVLFLSSSFSGECVPGSGSENVGVSVPIQFLCNLEQVGPTEC